MIATHKSFTHLVIIAGFLLTSSVYAQAPVIGGTNPSVGDVEYCQDGECVTIGKKKKRQKASEPVTHVFVTGKIPRKPNSNKKAERYYFDDLQEAIDRVAHNGFVYIHPGNHNIGTIKIDGPPRTIHLMAEETDVGRAYLKSPSSRCFIIDPDYSDDPARKNPQISIKDISIEANIDSKATSYEPDGALPACIEASRADLQLNRVEINTNGAASVGVRINNKKAVIARSRIISSRAQIEPPDNTSNQSSQKPPAPVLGSGIEVSRFAQLLLIGGGFNDTSIAGFETGIDVTGQISVTGAFLKNNLTGIYLHQGDDMMSAESSGTGFETTDDIDSDKEKTPEQINDAAEQAAIQITSSYIWLAESNANARLQSIGINVDDDYDRKLVLESVAIEDIFKFDDSNDHAYIQDNFDRTTPSQKETRLIPTKNTGSSKGYAFANGGIGLLARTFRYQPEIHNGVFRNLATGVDLTDSADFNDVIFDRNNIAMRLNYAADPIYALGGVSFVLDGVKFESNKTSLDLNFVDAGDLTFSDVVLAPSPLKKYRRPRNGAFTPGRNEINAPNLPNKRMRYPLTCDGDPKSDLYLALTKKYVCKISKK